MNGLPVLRAARDIEGIMIGFKGGIVVLLLLAINIGCAGLHNVGILKSGVENWNRWREGNKTTRPDLRKAHLKGANLAGANLEEANLLGADLEGANLEKADLQQAILKSANLEKADLRGANLRQAFVRNARLRGADLRGTNLEGADLRQDSLQGDSLQGDNLHGADLREAELHGADLFGTELDEADLRDVDLDEADLRNVKSLYKTKLDPEILAILKARWPEKLATVRDSAGKDWVVDDTLLAQIKKPDWHGWLEGEDQEK
jgi:uncharacterized protein YjbI with pentapeptide repeats